MVSTNDPIFIFIIFISFVLIAISSCVCCCYWDTINIPCQPHDDEDYTPAPTKQESRGNILSSKVSPDMEGKHAEARDFAPTASCEP